MLRYIFFKSNIKGKFKSNVFDSRTSSGTNKKNPNECADVGKTSDVGKMAPDETYEQLDMGWCIQEWTK